MKAFVEKYLPFILILLGALRLLWERFPSKFVFLRFLGGAYFGWVFWLLGITGVIWLLLRALGVQRSAVSDQWPVVSGKRSDKFSLRCFFEKYGIELLILLLTAASLSMLIRSGYYWDDAVNSTAYLAQKKDSVSTLRHVLDFMGDYLRLGRINVLSIYYYFFFYIENVSIYKALIILSILVNQLIFRKVLLEFGVPLNAARIGMVLIPLMLQTRAYQDPVSGFYSLMQVLTAEMLLCAMFLMRALRSGKGRHLALSLLFFGIGLMTYEVCFPFLLMICLLIWVRQRNFVQAVRGSLPFVGLTLLMLAGVVVVRAHFVTETTYAGVAFSLKPERILRAFLTQLCAGLPLSFYSAGYQASVLDNPYPAATIMQYDFLSFLNAVRFLDVLIVLGFLWVIGKSSKFKVQSSIENEAHGDWHLVPRSRQKRACPHVRCLTAESSCSNEQNVQWAELLVLGLSFAVLPTLTVAVSERYQGQLMPGLGYLPVYMQYYGVAALLLWFTLRLKVSDGVRALCLSAFSLILLLNLQNNRAVTEIMNRSFYYPRNAGEAALHSGILDFLPEDAVLISLNDRRYLWESNWNNAGLYKEFYGNNSRRLPAAVGDNRLLRDLVDDLLSAGAELNQDGLLMLHPENIWVIDYSGGPDRGVTRLGRLRYALADPDSLALRSTETDHVLYFLSGSFPEKIAVQYTGAYGEFHQLTPAEQLRVRTSENGILCQLPEDEEIIFASLK